MIILDATENGRLVWIETGLNVIRRQVTLHRCTPLILGYVT
jgi:hypothetical protein